MSILILKDHSRKTRYVESEDLTPTQIKVLCAVANATHKGTVPSISFTDEEAKTVSYTELIECKRFFSKANGDNGRSSRDTMSPRLMAFKGLGKSVCDKIAHDKQAEIDEQRVALNKKEQDREAKAVAEGRETEPGHFRDAAGHSKLDHEQEYLDAFKLAAEVLLS